MDLFDTAPRVDVDRAEYTRLLGFPRGHVLDGRALELADWARAWYAAHGRPWVYARPAEDVVLRGEAVWTEGVPLASPRLHRTLAEAGAHAVVFVAVSAGPELEEQARRAWLEEKPDEYFFLEMFGSAVVEHLTTTVGARLCAWADGEAMSVLPHYSPGYPEWDIADQSRLFGLLPPDSLPGPIEVFESGMLRPKKSLLAVFGLTRHLDRVRRLSDLVPCQACSFAPCQFRRVPYARAAQPAAAGDPEPETALPAAVSSPAIRYRTNQAALRRWAAERLSIETAADGSIAARFHYEGSTCSNMGRRLSFQYVVTLGPSDEGYPIRDERCTPAPDDEGHPFMCEYIRDHDLLEKIAAEQPLVGRPLSDVLAWDRPAMGPACYCEPDARRHKWGLVLETIHFALTRREEITRV
jgi:hypothetical protein